MALASVIGVLIPPAAVDAGRTVYRWVQPVEYSSGVLPDDAVSERELSAMTWLRDNSAPADVIATNLHCRPAPNEPYCDARGFWVVGLSGRRAVLEGWAYTDEAQALQGVEGRSYSHQPAPFVERARLNDAVFDDSDLDALLAYFTKMSQLKHDPDAKGAPGPAFANRALAEDGRRIASVETAARSRRRASDRAER